MNKTERIMLLKIKELSTSVPNFKNNMDMGGMASFRFDALEQAGFISTLLEFAIFYGNSTGDEKTHWKSEYDEKIREMEKFVEIRTSEEWMPHSLYSYQYARGGW